MISHHRHRILDEKRSGDESIAEFAKEFLGLLVKDYKALREVGAMRGGRYVEVRWLGKYLLPRATGMTRPVAREVARMLWKDEVLGLMLECAGLNISVPDFRFRLFEGEEG